MAQNQAAWLSAPGEQLQVGEAPMPKAGPGEIVIRNAAVAINPLDTHMHRYGVFIQNWPAVFGCDVAGIVHEVGPGVSDRLTVGDRVIGHTINLTNGRNQDGAFAKYTIVPADKAAILPDHISFVDGAVLPLCLEAAICALFINKSGVAIPGVPTPALALPQPSLEPKLLNKVIVVNGGSASSGILVTQMAKAAGLHVISILSKRHFHLAISSGANAVLDYHDTDVVEKVYKAVKQTGGTFIGIFDAISTDVTFPQDLALLDKLGGGHLACTHPPPKDLAPNVKAGMIFAVNDAAGPIWQKFVTPALEAGVLKCLPPPLIVGKGLDFIQTALEQCATGVSGQKLVVEL